MLQRAIESALRQSLPVLEIIVIDDGSTDNTASLMHTNYADNESVHFTVITHAGVSCARNAGIELAKGQWIALLDSDDIWHVNKLQRQIEHLQNNPGHLLCHSDEIWIRNEIRVNPMQKHQKRGGNIYQHCLPLCAISPSTTLIHHSLFKSVGLFDKDLPACEDYDLWLRICARHSILYIDEKLVTRYAGHSDQLSSQHWGMDRFRVAALEKIILSNSLSDEYRKLTISIMHKKCKVLIKGGTKRNNIDLVEKYQKILNQYQLQ